MKMLTFNEVGDALDDIAEQFPQVLFRELNGGVNLLEDTVEDPEFPGGELYIMGEFCDDCLGKYINLYYGSFVALAQKEDWMEQDWTDELWTTLSHELTHHMEGLGGLHGLDDRDAEELAEFREKYSRRKKWSQK
ncbi:hypothetical protein OBV_37680 [Oscillibacter valericigenes Sjm18-20]|nr:hypothetical protein OBV_37680 [Oscillibacter valericigenes Sjm18-20]